MRKIIFFVGLVCFTALAQAAVYKHVDEQGHVIKYSDKPQKPGDKPIDLPKPALTIESKPVPESTPTPAPQTKPAESEQQTKPETVYAAVAFIKPDDQAVIRANGGVFPVELASQPELDVDAGHHYTIMVDDDPHQDSIETHFNLENVDRGTHTLAVEVRDRSGHTLSSSSSITVYVQKASVLIHPLR